MGGRHRLEETRGAHLQLHLGPLGRERRARHVGGRLELRLALLLELLLLDGAARLRHRVVEDRQLLERRAAAQQALDERLRAVGRDLVGLEPDGADRQLGGGDGAGEGEHAVVVHLVALQLDEREAR
eukprot:6793517-Prymnesium_polylepis.1